MKIEISNGELLDKVTILQIKLLRISDNEKTANVARELEELYPYSSSIVAEYGLQDLFTNLREVNELLWDVEDAIREKERAQQFDDGFIQLARSVYFTNDKRADIKRRINLASKSTLIEEKSYEAY